MRLAEIRVAEERARREEQEKVAERLEILLKIKVHDFLPRTITNTRSFYDQLHNELLDAHRISTGCWNQVESTNIANNFLKRLKTEVLDSLEAKGMFFDPLEEEVKPSPNLTLR